MKKIIGIILVKNEDLFIERVLLNILHFCDEIIVSDNLSTDGTANIVKSLARQYPKVKYHLIEKIGYSHDLIKEFAGQDVWIFGVDGDEVYDPERLRIFREHILAGKYDKWWMIFGNVLHCTEFERESNTVHGHLAPPCRSMTKLYNFGIIESWESSSGERLHGGDIVFKKGYSKGLRCYLHEEYSWEEALFRCLHMCFSQRSSDQKTWKGEYLPRPNPADILSQTRLQWLWTKVRHIVGLPVQGKQEWKVEKFTRGSLVTMDCSIFFEESRQDD